MDCDICFEDYNQGERSPKIMPCGHTVCLQCLLQVGKRECPTCRTVYSVDAGSLTTNIALLRLSADVKVPRGWCSDCRGSATDECWNEHDVVLVQRALKRQLHGVAIQAAGYLEKLQGQCKGEQALTALSLLSRESCKLSVQAGEKLLTGTVRNTEDPLVKAMWLVLAAKANFTEERQTESPQPAGASSSLASTQRPIKGPLGHGMDLNKFVFCGPETKQEEKAATLKAVRGVHRLVDFHCNFDPGWSLRLLHCAAPTVQQLSLMCPQEQHLRAVHAMRLLRRLEVWCGDDGLSNKTVLTPLSPEQASLEWLRAHNLPRATLVSLLKAHAPTLKELQLWVGMPGQRDWPYSCSDLHSLLQQCALHGLQRLVLLRWSSSRTHSSPEDCTEQCEAVREALPGADVLCEVCHNVARQSF